MFEPLWSRQNIESVQITFKENLGTDGRGGYFDGFGISMPPVPLPVLLSRLALVAASPRRPCFFSPTCGPLGRSPRRGPESSPPGLHVPGDGAAYRHVCIGHPRVQGRAARAGGPSLRDPCSSYQYILLATSHLPLPKCYMLLNGCCSGRCGLLTFTAARSSWDSTAQAVAKRATSTTTPSLEALPAQRCAIHLPAACPLPARYLPATCPTVRPRTTPHVLNRAPCDILHPTTRARVSLPPFLSSHATRARQFAACVLSVDNERWAGVPFLLSAGKGLDERLCELRIRFKPQPYNRLMGADARNELVMRVQPDEALYMVAVAKQPGIAAGLGSEEIRTPVAMGLRYATQFGDGSPFVAGDAYERMFLNAARGDQSLSVSAAELVQAWRIFTPLLHQIDAERPQPVLHPFGQNPDGFAEWARGYHVEIGQLPAAWGGREAQEKAAAELAAYEATQAAIKAAEIAKEREMEISFAY